MEFLLDVEILPDGMHNMAKTFDLRVQKQDGSLNAFIVPPCLIAHKDYFAVTSIWAQ